LLGCLRKDVALCDTASRARGEGTEGQKVGREKQGTVRLLPSSWRDGTFHVHRLVSGVAFTEYATLLTCKLGTVLDLHSGDSAHPLAMDG